MAAACLTTLLAFVLIVYTSVVSISTLHAKDLNTVSAVDGKASNYFADNFYEYLHFGGNPSGSHNLPDPPDGPGVLRGRIMYQNQPAEGVTMHIVLNSKYMAKNIITDSDGIFSVSLPVGEWNVNSIQTKGWPNKPDDGEFTLYSGGEDKLHGNRFDRHTFFRKNGSKVTVDQNKRGIIRLYSCFGGQLC